MTGARAHTAMLTSHELVLLSLFRAVEQDRQREIAGVLYRMSSETEAARRFRVEGAALGVVHLEASVLKPFIEASRDTSPVTMREVA